MWRVCVCLSQPDMKKPRTMHSCFMLIGLPQNNAGPKLPLRYILLAKIVVSCFVAVLVALSIYAGSKFVSSFRLPSKCRAVQSNGTVDCATYCADGYSDDIDVGAVCITAKRRGLFGIGGSPTSCRGANGSALECCCGPPTGYGAAARELCAWLYYARPDCPPPWLDSTCTRQKLRQAAVEELTGVAELKEVTLSRCLGELQLEEQGEHVQPVNYFGGIRGAAREKKHAKRAIGQHPGDDPSFSSATQAVAEQVRGIVAARAGELRSQSLGNGGHQQVNTPAPVVWLCCIVKLQAAFVPYWITWHLLLGVSHVLVYDNHGSDKHDQLGAHALRKCLKPFIDAGFVTLIPFRGMGQQVRLVPPCPADFPTALTDATPPRGRYRRTTMPSGALAGGVPILLLRLMWMNWLHHSATGIWHSFSANVRR